jgi:hypothetical protein
MPAASASSGTARAFTDRHDGEPTGDRPAGVAALRTNGGRGQDVAARRAVVRPSRGVLGGDRDARDRAIIAVYMTTAGRAGAQARASENRPGPRPSSASITSTIARTFLVSFLASWMDSSRGAFVRWSSSRADSNVFVASRRNPRATRSPGRNRNAISVTIARGR